MGKRTQADRQSDARYRQDHASERREYAKDHRRKSRYGITGNEFNSMLVSQGGLCAICGEPETLRQNGVVQNLSIDHCHQTGILRGLICNSCNIMLGRARDNPKILAKAVDYLARSRVGAPVLKAMNRVKTKWPRAA